jgi:hypothetical protein
MYIVLKDLLLKGKRYVASDVIEAISDEDAKSLSAMGRIEPVDVKPVESIDRSVGLSDDAKLKKRSVKKKSK